MASNNLGRLKLSDNDEGSHHDVVAYYLLGVMIAIIV